MNGKIFRSKLKWTEEEEKNSKYFLSLEKRNYTNKYIYTRNKWQHYKRPKQNLRGTKSIF